jgi:hypothetical protein
LHTGGAAKSARSLAEAARESALTRSLF